MRFTLEEIEDTIRTSREKRTVVLVAIGDGRDEEPPLPTDALDGVVGAVQVDWSDGVVACEHPHADDPAWTQHPAFVGHFGALSVPVEYGRRGIARLLVASAEAHCRAAARSVGAPYVHMSMPVITLQPHLFPFYDRQGYVQGRTAPFVVPHICRPEVQVNVVFMHKRIDT